MPYLKKALLHFKIIYYLLRFWCLVCSLILKKFLYFLELIILGSEPLGISTTPFSLSELTVVIKQLKSSKAFGPDNIPALIWKDEHFNSILLNLCNHNFDTYKPPNIWHKSQIIPMPKKGDLSLPTNYRGILLMPIAAKIYNTFCGAYSSQQPEWFHTRKIHIEPDSLSAQADRGVQFKQLGRCLGIC